MMRVVVRRRHRVAVVLITGVLAVLVSPVGAQPDDKDIEMDPEPGSGSGSGSASGSATGSGSGEVVKDPRAAKKLVAAAQIAVQRGDYFTRYKKTDEANAQYELAVAQYEKALELGDDLGVGFELATVEDKLGKTDAAARHWRAVVKAQGLKPDLQKKASAKLDDALTKLGLVTLVVKPEGATISLTGTELGKAPLPEPLILLPGTYAFQIAADGFQPKEIELKVEAGSESERGIELEPVKIVVEPVRPRVVDDDKPPPPRPPSRTVLYAGGGATIGFVAVATVTGVLALGKHGTFTANDSSAGERRDAKDSGQRLAKITDGMLVGALVAGGFTTYWYMFKYKPAQKKLSMETETKVTVAPWVQHDTGGFSLAGRF